MDWVRWIYYNFMIKTGIADTYRYEQFIKKSDTLYDLELLLFSCNMNSIDKKMVLENLMIISIYYFVLFLDKFDKIIPLKSIPK